MKLYLSGVLEHKEPFFDKVEDVWDLENLHILQSYAYANDKSAELYPLCKSFLMDSGAFTIMNASKKKKGGFDIKKFAKEYAQFVKKHNVKDFLEMDIDSVFGFEVYKDCLHMIQDITGLDPIRVFHDWRGKDYYLELVKNKPRIAFGGVAAGITVAFSRANLHWFATKAHENNCKLHALGVTDPHILRRCAFDSCDSSTWSSGLRFGNIYRFDGHQCKMYDSSRKNCPEGQQISRPCVYYNARDEWCKYAKYLDEII